MYRVPVETGFTLVILNVDTRDAFQRISDVRVRKLTYLIGRNHILDAQTVLCELMARRWP